MPRARVQLVCASFCRQATPLDTPIDTGVSILCIHFPAQRPDLKLDNGSGTLSMMPPAHTISRPGEATVPADAVLYTQSSATLPNLIGPFFDERRAQLQAL